MSYVRHLVVPTPSAAAATDATTVVEGLTVAHVLDGGVAYLLVRAEDPGDPLTLLLPAPADSLRGLSVFSRLGRLHARHWGLIWGPGEPPTTGVDFSSGDLRFRRGRHSTAVAVGPSWLAAAEGAFREASADPDGPAPCWLPLTPSW